MSKQSLTWSPIFLATLPIMLCVIGLMSLMSSDDTLATRRTAAPNDAANVDRVPTAKPAPIPSDGVDPADVEVPSSIQAPDAEPARSTPKAGTSGASTGGQVDWVGRVDLKDLQDAAFGRMTNRCRRLLERAVNSGTLSVGVRRSGGSLRYDVTHAGPGPLPDKIKRCINPSCDSPSYRCDLAGG